jgi:hypothetical protein
MEQIKRPAVAFLLLCISIIALIGSFAGYSLSDVHNTYDFLTPVIGVVQFIFIFALFKGKLWGLIGYTVACLGLLVAVFTNYVPKDQTNIAIRTSIPIVILLLLAVDLWTQKRRFFK